MKEDLNFHCHHCDLDLNGSPVLNIPAGKLDGANFEIVRCPQCGKEGPVDR
jgi:hypothetical protein